MPIHEVLGWSASAMMIATFACRHPLWMRLLAVCTNLAFMSYAVSAGLHPVLALHAILLPINVVRGWQAWHGCAGRDGPRLHNAERRRKGNTAMNTKKARLHLAQLRPPTRRRVARGA